MPIRAYPAPNIEISFHEGARIIFRPTNNYKLARVFSFYHYVFPSLRILRIPISILFRLNTITVMSVLVCRSTNACASLLVKIAISFGISSRATMSRCALVFLGIYIHDYLGFHVAAMCCANTRGILAILAEAALRALLWLDVLGFFRPNACV